MRARRLIATLCLAGLAALAAPGIALADDTTPPVGTLEVEGGIGYTTDGSVVLDVPATDDVGVTLLRVRDIQGNWIDYPYTPQVIWTFDPSQFAQQQLTVAVEWRDAAGNASGAQATFWYDAAPPELQTFQTTNDIGPPGTITFYVGAYEEASGVAAVRFSTDDGAHWGAEIPMTDQLVVWDPHDAAVGGKPGAVGAVTVMAQVRDGVGQWSNTRSTTVQLTASVSIAVSANPTTGQSITFTPTWSEPVTMPAGTFCMWEFMTGDDQSLYYGNRDDSFSYNLTQGPASGGWCGPWTFTLPWSTVRQYLVSFRVMLPDGSQIDDLLGGSPDETAFSSTVGSTSHAIKSSNLPMFYVLPDDYQLTLGVPTTYRAFAIGGASIRSSDQWVIEYENVPEFHPGASSLTFTPKKTGHLTVCLYRRAGNTPMDQLGACFDPPVRKASGGTSGGGGATSPPAAGTPEASVGPSDAAPSASSPASGGSPSASPGDVAVASSEPGVASSESPEAGSGGSPGGTGSAPGPALVAAAILVLVGGAVLVMRPGLRMRLRSRIGLRR